MLQAITTKYHGATDTKGSRISATTQAGRIYVAYDYGLDTGPNHRAAAMECARRLGWVGAYGGGMNHKSEGVWVHRGQSSAFTIREKIARDAGGNPLIPAPPLYEASLSNPTP